MYIKTTFEQEFYDLMMYLKAKYPKKLFDISGIGKQTDMTEFSKDFFSNKKATADISVDDNSNVDDKSVIAYATELPKAFFKYNSYYVLWKKLKQLYSQAYANKIIEEQLNGQIYINDLHGIGAGMSYCFNYSTLDVAMFGLPMVKKIKSSAPKHLLSFKSQMEQFMVLASNSTLGATGIADYLLTVSIYVDKMLKTNKDSHFTFASKDDVWLYIKELITSFIYVLNQPLRGNQSCFSNISIYDDNFIDNTIETYVLEIDEEIYSATKENVKKLQELFIDIMNDEFKRTTFTFPVTTACFAIDDDKNIKDLDFLSFISEKNIEFGFINIYVGKESTLSSCCRLRSDLDTIGYQNSIGGSGTKIGSLGVCTLNLPRLAFENKGKDEEEFFIRLEELVNHSQSVNNAKRKIVQKRIDNFHAPMYNHGFIDIEKQYSTCGIIGLNECLEILDLDILTEEGQNFAIKIMNLINSINVKLDKKYNCSHNVEQIPGESSSVKLALKDNLLKFNTEYEFYSNQFIPLITDANLLDRLSLQGKFDKHFSGGSIAHINIEKQITDKTKMENLILSTAKQGVVYFAINYAINACENDHISIGSNVTKCKICNGKITDTFTRVVGFLTNVKDWNEVRREKDFPNRKFYEGI